MASKLALAGLLGAASNAGQEYLARERALEERKLQDLREARKEEALLLRQKSLAEFNYGLGQNERDYSHTRDTVTDKRESEKISEGKRQHEDSSKLARERLAMDKKISDKPSSLQERINIINSSDLTKDEKKAAIAQALNPERQSDYDKKISSLEADASLTPDEKKAVKYGIQPKGAMSDYQKIKAEEDYNKLVAGGVDETNLAQVNRLGKQLGIPEYRKNLKTPEKKGFWSDTPAEYDYTQGGDPVAGAEKRPSDPVDKYKSLLLATGSKDGIMELSEPKVKPGILAAGPSAPPTGGPQQSKQPLAPERESGEILPYEERKKFAGMTVEQLQAVRDGFLESASDDVVNSQKGKAFLRELDSIIASKS